MPIYEFYCADCHTLYNFFSPRIDTSARPACPRCGRPEIERRPARFATLTRSGGGESDEGGDDDPLAGLDEERLERAMESMAGEMEGMSDDEDPRAMAKFLRRFGEAAGMGMGPRMEEMLRRLEAGEDPDVLEEEMGEPGEGEDDLSEWFAMEKAAAGLRRRSRRPRVDDTLYFL